MTLEHLMDDGPITVDTFSPEEWSVIRAAVEQDFYLYTRLMFRAVYGRRWVEAPFQRVVCQFLQDVYEGKIVNGIINIPPRYGKTHMTTEAWVSWCLAKRPISRFLHSSYSDELLYQNSRHVQDVIANEVYQLLWPCRMRADASAKRAWTLAEVGGGLNCAPVGGQLTGFGAGVTGETAFSGARILDDYIKVGDAASPVLLKRANNWYFETFASRTEHRAVPTVVICQRVHERDLTAVLVRGGGAGKWHHLVIPALVEETGQDYPRDYEFGIEVPHGLPPGPIWEYKHTDAELAAMRDDPVTEYVYWTQYQQRPTPRGGTMVQRHWVGYWSQVGNQWLAADDDQLDVKRIYLDTAQKKEERHDYSAGVCAARGQRGVYVLDLLHQKFSAPELVTAVKEFVLRHRFKQFENHLGINRVCVEDKSSGTGLIQTLNVDDEFLRTVGIDEITGIPRNRDKVSRMYGVAPWIKAGKLFVRAGQWWTDLVINELSAFTAEMTHANDDICDVIMDAIEDLLIRDAQEDIDYGRY